VQYGAWLEQHIGRYVDELSRFAAIPSVAGDADAIAVAAQFTADAFRRRGFHAEVIPSRGNPVVVATGGSGEASLLLYNHYDVQPAGRTEEWRSDPFAPVLSDGMLYGRGIIDDKGEIVARLAAIDALKERFGELPLRIVTCIEGEEETGSSNLAPFLAEHADRLAAGACLWEGGMVDAAGRPHMWLGVRGLVFVHLSVTTLRHDAHSGFAHVLPSAAWRLVHALATLAGADGRVLVEGLNEAACGPTSAQNVLLTRMPDEDDDFRAEFGVERFVAGRTARDLREAVFLPTCNLCGLHSGAERGQTRTIVPATAHASLDLRLPPGVTPERAVNALRAHLDRAGFADVQMRAAEAERAACSDPEHPFVGIASSALCDVYGVEPVVSPLVGGTGPAAHVVETLDLPFVSIGCSYPGSRKHAPNEHLRLRDFILGAAAIATLMERFAFA